MKHATDNAAAKLMAGFPGIGLFTTSTEPAEVEIAEAALPPEEEPTPPVRREMQMVRMLKGQDIILSPLVEVSYFEAHGKFTRVVLRDQEGLLQMGLSAVESKLPKDRFLKIHRSLIVNITQVQKVKRDEFGRLGLFVLGRTEKLGISRPHEYLFRVGIF